MAQLGRITYILGWICTIVAVVERILLWWGNMAERAKEVNVLPRNFLDLALVLFVISIASDLRCRAEKT